MTLKGTKVHLQNLRPKPPTQFGHPDLLTDLGTLILKTLAIGRIDLINWSERLDLIMMECQCGRRGSP
jgi:hypothetical protein